MNHLASSVSVHGSVWDKGTDRKQTLFETIKPYYTLMRKYIGEPRAWGKLGVLLPFPSTRARPGAVLPSGSGSSFSSAVGLLCKPDCCKAFRQGSAGVHCPCVPVLEGKIGSQQEGKKQSCSAWSRGAPFVPPSLPLASGSCGSLEVNGEG